jgi:Flp pilus assembly protein TadB
MRRIGAAGLTTPGVAAGSIGRVHQANIRVLADGVLAGGGAGHHGLRILILVLIIVVVAVTVGWVVYSRRMRRRQR